MDFLHEHKQRHLLLEQLVSLKKTTEQALKSNLLLWRVSDDWSGRSRYQGDVAAAHNVLISDVTAVTLRALLSLSVVTSLYLWFLFFPVKCHTLFSTAGPALCRSHMSGEEQTKQSLVLRHNNRDSLVFHFQIATFGKWMAPLTMFKPDTLLSSQWSPQFDWAEYLLLTHPSASSWVSYVSTSWILHRWWIWE